MLQVALNDYSTTCVLYIKDFNENSSLHAIFYED